MMLIIIIYSSLRSQRIDYNASGLDPGCLSIGVRANIHLGGQTEFCPNGFGGGGGSSTNFLGSIFCGVPEFFPSTPVTDPNFVFFSR